jgi:hypothetical protein
MAGQLKLALSNQRSVTSWPLTKGIPNNNDIYTYIGQKELGR